MVRERVRRLAAVWFADIVGYTRLSARHEDVALAVVDEFQAASREAVEAHGGRIVKYVGDAVLVVFESADAALKAAMALRTAFRDAPTAHTFGIHLGEVVEADDGDVYGDGVNVAARVQGKAGPGQILASRSVADLIRGRPEFQVQQLPPWVRLKGLGFAQLFSISAAGEPPPPRRITQNKAVAVGITAGLVAFIGLVVSQGFGDGGPDVGPAGSTPSASTPAAPPRDASVELDIGTDAYFAGEFERAARLLNDFAESPLRETPQAAQALRYLARAHLGLEQVDLARHTLEQFVSIEPPMRLLLPNVESDSLFDLYYEVRTDARRSAAGTPVMGIIVFDLRLASDMDDPMLRDLGSQVSQMLVSELGARDGPGAYPWDVRYPWDGLAAYAGEGAYQYFQDKILMGQTMPATHALFGRLAIRGGQMSLSARSYEMATGGVVASETLTGVWPDSLFEVVEQLGAALGQELLEGQSPAG